MPNASAARIWSCISAISGEMTRPSLARQRRHLVAERLARAGRHHRERVAAGHDPADHLGLDAAEVGKAERIAKDVERVAHGVQLACWVSVRYSPAGRGNAQRFGICRQRCAALPDIVVDQGDGAVARQSASRCGGRRSGASRPRPGRAAESLRRPVQGRRSRRRWAIRVVGMEAGLALRRCRALVERPEAGICRYIDPGLRRDS